MKALTLTQPWAALVALEEKHVETRSWKVPERYHHQEIAIHAAKTYRRREFADLTHREPFYSALRPGGQYCYPEMMCGQVLCVVKITACQPTDLVRINLSDKELSFGNYKTGRWAIFLEFVRHVNPPVPAVGHLNLWDWNP